MTERTDLHAFADGELPSVEATALDAEIAASPALAAEVERIRSIKQCLATHAVRHEAPEVWKGCVGRLDEIDRVRKAEHFVGKYAWAICSLLFLVIVSGGILTRARGGSMRMGDVAAVSAGLVPTSNPHLSAPEQIPTLIDQQIGERPTFMLDPRHVVGVAASDQPMGRVIDFHLRDEIGDADVMVIPQTTVEGVQPMGDGLSAGEINGVNCVAWRDGGCSVLLIAPRSHEELRAMAHSFYR